MNILEFVEKKSFMKKVKFWNNWYDSGGSRQANIEVSIRVMKS